MRPLRAPPAQGGHTLIEVVVAFTVLSVGSAVLWYDLRASARLERMNRLHHEANRLARSELESLRAVPRREVRDTSYRAPGGGGEALLVVREVFDSARVVAALDEVVLDDALSPVELRKPLEVRVRVFDASGAEGDAVPAPSAWGDPWEDGAEGGARALATLILKLPDYRWH